MRRSRKYTIFIIGIFAIFSAAAYFIRYQVVEKRIKATVTTRMADLFGEFISYKYESSSLLFGQVTLTSVKIEQQIPGYSFLPNGSVEKLVLKAGFDGVRRIILQQAELTIDLDTIREIDGTSFTVKGEKGKRIRKFPSINFSRCHLITRSSKLPVDLQEQDFQQVSGRVTVRNKALAARFRATSTGSVGGSLSAIVHLDLSSYDFKLSFTVDDIDPKPVQELWYSAVPLNVHDGTCNVEGNITRQKGSWKVSGTADLNRLSLAIQDYAVRIPKVTLLDRQLETDVLFSDLAITTQPVHVLVDLVRFSPLTANGECSLERLHYKSLTMSDIHFMFNLDSQRIEIQEGSAVLGSGNLNFKGHLKPGDEKPAALSLTVDSVKPGDIFLWPIPETWDNLNGQAELNGSFNNPSSWNLEGEASLATVTFALNGSLDLKNLRFNEGSRIDFKRLKAEDIISLSTISPNVPPPLVFLKTSTWNGEILITGPFAAPVIRIDGTSEKNNWGPFGRGQLNLILETSPGNFTVSHIILEQENGSSLTFTGALSLKTVQGEITGDLLPLTGLPGMKATATISGTAAGTPGKPIVNLLLELTGLSWKGAAISDLTVKVVIQDSKLTFSPPDGETSSAAPLFYGTLRPEGGYLHFENLSLKAGNREIQGSARLPLAGDGAELVQVRIWSDLGPLSYLSQIIPDWQILSGRGGGALSLDGSLDHPVINGSITMADLTFKTANSPLSLRGITITVPVKNNIFECTGSIVGLSSPVRISGRLDTNDPTDLKAYMDINLEETRLKLSDFFAGGSNDLFESEGTVQADLDLIIEPRQAELSGKIFVSDAKIFLPPGMKHKKGSASNSGEGLAINISIDAGKQVLIDGSHFTLDVSGSITAERHDGNLTFDGSLSANRGTISYLNNRFDVTGGSIRFASFRETQNRITLFDAREFKLPPFTLATQTSLSSDSLTVYHPTTAPHVLGPTGSGTGSGQDSQTMEIDLQASTRVADTTITMHIVGKEKEYHTVFSSTPPKPREQIMALLTGKGTSPEEGGPDIMGFVETGMTGSFLSGLGDSISRTFDLDSFSITTSSRGKSLLGGPSFRLGKYLDDDLYVTYEHIGAVLEKKTLELEYQVNSRFSLDGAIRTLSTEDDVRLGIKFKRPF